MSFQAGLTIFIFLVTMLVIFWRPMGLNEAYPAVIGAVIILMTGNVTRANLVDIFDKIGGASITIMATIVMAVILESFGLFHWAAAKLVSLAKGSGYRLYWYIQLLCFLMTLLFNNDGSILITTPILILLLKNLQLKPHQQIPYLLTGAFTATASSAPIGVSNIVNLIGLNIVHMTLYMQTAMIFVPAILGLLFMSGLMYLTVKRKLPPKLRDSAYDIEASFFSKPFHPLKSGEISVEAKANRTKFMLKILLFVFIMRCLLFAASFLSIPVSFVAVLGSVCLLLFRWYYLRINPIDVLKKTPWHILIFAFSMYVIIYGLHNIGLTALLIKICEPLVHQGLFAASIVMGVLVSLLANLFNNHPALMVGTITLTEMGLDPVSIKMIYLANIIGSDMGSLLLPIGTLASLLWMYILKQHKIRIKWKDYLKISFVVIPLSTIVTLCLLFYWVQWMFA